MKKRKKGLLARIAGLLKPAPEAPSVAMLQDQIYQALAGMENSTVIHAIKCLIAAQEETTNAQALSAMVEHEPTEQHLGGQLAIRELKDVLDHYIEEGTRRANEETEKGKE